MINKELDFKLSSLIYNGNAIKDEIKYIPAPDGVWRAYDIYEFENHQEFEIWKNSALRLLSSEFNDRSVRDFEEAIKKMDKTNYPSYMDKLIGILVSCEEIPIIKQALPDKEISHTPTINIHNTQNQTQSQEIAVNIFLEAIKDELTGKQLKEIKKIIKEEGNTSEGKEKIIEKLKNFGENILSNIIANVITNPSIWSNF